MPNPRAKAEHYCQGFGLTAHEFEIIRALPDTSRAFLIKHGRDSVVAQLDLSGERDLLTGQIFFPDRFSRAVFDQLPDYARDSTRGRIFNDRDGIARRAGQGAYAEVTQVEGGFDAAMVIGLSDDRAALL